MPAPKIWHETTIIAAVQRFMVREGRPPTRQDFCPAQGLPTIHVVDRTMRSWQDAVRRAGGTCA
jgi:hypothetical protein